MEWNHLPVIGGIYDQSAQLLDEWVIIFNEHGAHQKREEEQRKRDQDRKKHREELTRTK